MSDGAGHESGTGLGDLATLMDAYLDGTLDAEQRRRFEERLGADMDAAQELALQRRMDESIKRQYEPPAGSAVVGSIRPAVERPGGSRRLLSRPLAAAAVLALAAIGGYWAINGSPFGVSSSGTAMSTPQAVYQRVVDGGFKPEWVCEDAKQFAQYTQDQFGAPWSVAPAEGLTLVGWRYSHDLLGPEASLLLAEKGGEKIVVVADKAAHDRRLRDGGGLHVFRRAVGGLVMYEISPLEKPEVVERISVGSP